MAPGVPYRAMTSEGDMTESAGPTAPVPLRWRNVEALPLIHGRLPFALAVRERMLAQRHGALAVELPRSLREAVLKGIRRLPAVHAVVYREPAAGEAVPTEEGQPSRAWYVPIDPCDAIIEALRIADRERIPMHFVDAEVEQFSGQMLRVPDSHALLTLGVSAFYQAVLGPLRALHPATPEDDVRERHMAARLHDLSRSVGENRNILFLCGMAHWERILGILNRRAGQLHDAPGPPVDEVMLVQVDSSFVYHMLGETPHATNAFERHRSGFEIDRHDQVLAVKELLLEAREHYEKNHQDSLERATPAALRTVLNYTRKLTVSAGRLTPDLYSLVVAAKGVVGNDFALSVLEVARAYPPNSGSDAPDTPPEGAVASESVEEFEQESEDSWSPDGDPDSWKDAQPRRTGSPPQVNQEVEQLISRTPGAYREIKRVKLEERPPPADQERWRTAWDPYHQCSWPPEDVVIENLRTYVSSRCLSMAGLDRVNTEEFSASLKDGLALRETLRDLPRRKLHVRIEPRIPGRVGAVVIIFEEDDAGTRYPWRATWMAEHDQESTLAFYATNFMDDIVGPGIGRAWYGGCMFVYPPVLIPDVWDDLRFEKARRPSERLLLAALTYSNERFIAHVSARPPSDEIRATAETLGRHIVHLPLTTFSARTLEKVRRVHVLNGQSVRSFAQRYIR